MPTRAATQPNPADDSPEAWDRAFPGDQTAFLAWAGTDMTAVQCRATADQYRHLGLDDADAAEWFRAGFTAADAAEWLAAGFEPEDADSAAGYRDNGLPPEVGYSIEYG